MLTYCTGQRVITETVYPKLHLSFTLWHWVRSSIVLGQSRCQPKSTRSSSKSWKQRAWWETWSIEISSKVNLRLFLMHFCSFFLFHLFLPSIRFSSSKLSLHGSLSPAEIKLICIMKVGPIHCTELKKKKNTGKKRKTAFIRGWARYEPQDWGKGERKKQ